MTDAQINLERLIVENGDDFLSISRMLGRNAAYIQQYIRRGVPRKLDEDDRRTLARYFGVDETELGGPNKTDAGPAIAFVPKLDVSASAGPGSVIDREKQISQVGFETEWLRKFGSNPGNLSIIQVSGDSMAPTLLNGDDILVDQSAVNKTLRSGIFVIRLDGGVHVKRLKLQPGRRVVTIQSDNPEYPTQTGQEVSSLSIIGRVVWVGRKL